MKSQKHGIMKLIIFAVLKAAAFAFVVLCADLLFRFSTGMKISVELFTVTFFAVLVFSALTIYMLVKEVINPLEYFLGRFEKIANVSCRVYSEKASRQLYATLCRIDFVFTKLIDNLNQTSDELKEANERLSRVYTIIEKSPIVVFEWSIVPGTPVDYVSDNIRKYGYEPSEFLSGVVDYWDMLHPDDVSAAQQKIWGSRKQKEITETRQTYRVICKDGTQKWVEELTYYERDEHGNMITEKGILSDVTEMKMAEAKITWLTYHDKLTGLYNRTWIEDRFATLDNEINSAATIMIGDMNGLKLINDLLGHKAGDELLKSMGNILRKAIRGTNYEAARLGGDEFIIVLDGATEEDANKLASSIHLLCNQKVSGSFTPSISWGCCGRIENERKLTDYLLKEADQRMYNNKEQEARNTKANLLKAIQDSFKREPNANENSLARKRRDSDVIGDNLDFVTQFRINNKNFDALNNTDKMKALLEKKFDPSVVDAFLESLEKIED